MTSKRFLLSTLLALATVAVMIFASPFPLQASEGVPVDSFSLNFEPIKSTYPELEKTLIAERYDDHEIDRMLTLVEAYLVLACDTKLRPSFADFLRANGLTESEVVFVTTSLFQDFTIEQPVHEFSAWCCDCKNCSISILYCSIPVEGECPANTYKTICSFDTSIVYNSIG